MHVVGRLFDALAARSDLPESVRQRFRTAVRLAVLCHDLGHMPSRHASERIAPPRAALGLPAWTGPDGGQATHEDFTVKLLLDTDLADLVRGPGGRLRASPREALAALVTGRTPPGGLDFRYGGADWSPLLRALVSGELDADRMDYLLRDSFYTGVNYGRYDLDWLVQNLHPARAGWAGGAGALRSAAFAFEDFLLSRLPHVPLGLLPPHRGELRLDAGGLLPGGARASSRSPPTRRASSGLRRRGPALRRSGGRRTAGRSASSAARASSSWPSSPSATRATTWRRSRRR